MTILVTPLPTASPSVWRGRLADPAFHAVPGERRGAQGAAEQGHGKDAAVVVLVLKHQNRGFHRLKTTIFFVGWTKNGGLTMFH